MHSDWLTQLQSKAMPIATAILGWGYAKAKQYFNERPSIEWVERRQRDFRIGQIHDFNLELSSRYYRYYKYYRPLVCGMITVRNYANRNLNVWGFIININDIIVGDQYGDPNYSRNSPWSDTVLPKSAIMYDLSFVDITPDRQVPRCVKVTVDGEWTTRSWLSFVNKSVRRTITISTVIRS